MGALADIVANGRPVEAHRPWPRAVVGADAWRAAGTALAAGDGTLLGLWGDDEAVHMAVRDLAGFCAVLTCVCPDGSFPSIAAAHAPAIRLERAIRDLFGLTPLGLPDERPWLDHGRWESAPPSRRIGAVGASANAPYPFLPAEGESLHQIPVGPVHAGIIEPGHFRFTASGETVVRLDERLGYVHKGVEGLMAGGDLARAARLAGRVSGDSTVAYALAFARAVEAALGVDVPARAVWLRALMAELERVANHFGDIGAICNDAAFAILHAHCAVLREKVLRFAGREFGHRLMMDTIAPGGVAADLGADARLALAALVLELRSRFATLVKVYDHSASLLDRTVGTGELKPDLAARFGAGGFVGRASGRTFDARADPGYAPYDLLGVTVPTLDRGDVNARVWIRVHEVEASLTLIDRIVDGLPGGPLATSVTAGTGEGVALIEGFRGDVLAWVRLGADGRIARCHLRDPSWFQWPLLEAAIEGNIVADFPLVNKSFNCSYSGHDL